MKAFEEWLNTISETIVLSTTEYDRLGMAYRAGMLRTAEIADKYRDAGCVVSVAGSNIANAIRKEADSGKQ